MKFVTFISARCRRWFLDSKQNTGMLPCGQHAADNWDENDDNENNNSVKDVSKSTQMKVILWLKRHWLVTNNLQTRCHTRWLYWFSTVLHRSSLRCTSSPHDTDLFICGQAPCRHGIDFLEISLRRKWSPPLAVFPIVEFLCSDFPYLWRHPRLLTALVANSTPEMWRNLRFHWLMLHIWSR